MKGCYKTKDILKRGTILCMAAMLSFGAVNLQALLKRVQKVQPAVVQKRVRAQKVLQAAAQTILQVRNQKLLQMTRLAVLQVQGLHQEQHQKVKWIKDDRKSVCFNRRTLLIFAGNLFRRGAGYEERTGIAY